MWTFSTGQGYNLSAMCTLLAGCVLLLGATRGISAQRVNSLKRQRCALEAEIVERKQAEEALRASQESLRHSHTQFQGLAAPLIKAIHIQEHYWRKRMRRARVLLADDHTIVAQGLASLLKVLRLIAEGQRLKEIAATLLLSTRTVETHKYAMK